MLATGKREEQFDGDVSIRAGRANETVRRGMNIRLHIKCQIQAESHFVSV